MTSVSYTHLVWYENKQRQDQFELNENAKLTRDIQRIKTAASQAKTLSVSYTHLDVYKRQALSQ